MKCGLRRGSVSEKDLTMPLYYEQNVELVKQFSLRDKIKNIFNQLDLNSCSANAVSKQISIAADLDYDVSRLFIYYNSRLVETEYNKRSISDDGCNLRSVMKAFMKFNFLDERYYTYKTSLVNSEPSEQFYKIDNENSKFISQYRKIKLFQTFII